jgi:hypothetical protein
MAKDFLRRYTDIPALIYLLSERKLSLLNPQRWDDSNDSHYLAVYKQKKRLKTVLAACFTQADETYHHWRVFAGGASGVCVTFHREALLKAVKRVHGLRSRSVEYLKLNAMRPMTLSVADLPFLKRFAFEHENEFRIIFESRESELQHLDIPISLSCIDKITLSPWINLKLSSRLRRLLSQIEGCGKLKIRRSTLIGNEEWKRKGDRAQ